MSLSTFHSRHHRHFPDFINFDIILWYELSGPNLRIRALLPGNRIRSGESNFPRIHLASPNQSFKRFYMDPQLIILGPLKLQNDLLTFFIGRSTRMSCVRAQEYNFAYIADLPKDQVPMILWDCLGVKSTHLVYQYGKDFESLPVQCPVAIFNATAGNGIESEAFKLGIRGLIYEDDPPAVIIQGILKMCRGELWYPKDKLARVLLKPPESNTDADKKSQVLLTPRERQILSMVANGAANDQIAQTLCISPHTVKTHLYNIYAKIRVPNRTQAALWAAKNFS